MKGRKVAFFTVALLAAGALWVRQRGLEPGRGGTTAGTGEHHEAKAKPDRPSVSVSGRELPSQEEPDRLALDRLEEAIRNLRFPAHPGEARKMLMQELEQVLAIPLLWVRGHLLCLLGERFSISAWEASGSAQEYSARMEILREAMEASADKLDDKTGQEEVLIHALAAGVSAIDAMPESSRETWLHGLMDGSSDDVGEMKDRLIAALTLHEYRKGDPESLFDLTQIADLKVRAHAESELFRTSDFTMKSEAYTRSAAAYFLGPESQVRMDKNVFIRLFGLGTATHPEAVSREVLKAPKSMKRDLAIEQMIFRIMPHDPESARLWFAEIDDPAVKKRAEVDISGERVRHTPPAPTAPANDPGSDPFLR